MKCKCRISSRIMNTAERRRSFLIKMPPVMKTRIFFSIVSFHFLILISGFSLNINEKISTKYSAAAFVVRSKISALRDLRFIDTKMFFTSDSDISAVSVAFHCQL